MRRIPLFLLTEHDASVMSFGLIHDVETAERYDVIDDDDVDAHVAANVEGQHGSSFEAHEPDHGFVPDDGDDAES